MAVHPFEPGHTVGNSEVIGRTARFIIWHNHVTGKTYRRKVHVNKEGLEYIVTYRTGRTMYVRYAEKESPAPKVDMVNQDAMVDVL